jgi:hypothetical protein
MTSELVQVSFDYTGFSLTDTIRLQTISAVLNADAEQIDELLQRDADLLIEAQQIHKRRVGHEGDFVEWVKIESPFNRDFVYKLIAARQNLTEPEFQTGLKLGKTKFLIYGSLSESIRHDIQPQIENGEIKTKRELQEAIVKVKAEKAAREEVEAKLKDTQIQLQRFDYASKEQYQSLMSAQARAEESSQKVEALEKQIQKLQQQQKPETKEIRVEVPVIPPEMTTQLEELKRQKREAEKRVKELQEEANERAVKDLRGENEQRIRLQWSTNANKILKNLQECMVLIPSLTSTYAFENTDWGYVSDIANTVQVLQMTVHQLQVTPSHIIDA